MEMQPERAGSNQIVTSKPLVIITAGGCVLVPEDGEGTQVLCDLARAVEALERPRPRGTITSTADEPAPSMASG